MSDIPSDISHDQHAVRRQKLADLRAAGLDPFRANCATTHFSADAMKAARRRAGQHRDRHPSPAGSW
jgi:lysyl-tRNA synthetase class 2